MNNNEKKQKGCFKMSNFINKIIFSRKRKHIMKEKRKIRDRLALKMILPGDVHDHETAEGGKNDQGLFDLEKIKTKKVCYLKIFHFKNFVNIFLL
jgi:hypothetical protein